MRRGGGEGAKIGARERIPAKFRACSSSGVYAFRILLFLPYVRTNVQHSGRSVSNRRGGQEEEALDGLVDRFDRRPIEPKVLSDPIEKSGISSPNVTPFLTDCGFCRPRRYDGCAFVGDERAYRIE